MFKKLIALVEALMLVSLFCIGFASWSITDPNGIEITLNDGGFQTQETQEVLLSEIGIAADNIGGHPSDASLGSTGFKYSLIESTATFAKTTLTLNIPITIATFEELEIDHDIKYALVIECINPNAGAFDIFTSTTYLTAPTVATANLLDLPNITISGNVTGTTKTVNGQKTSKLSAYFPLKSSSGECLYHLINRATGETAWLTFTFNFTPAASVNSNYVKAICMTAYTFNVGVGTKK